MALVQEVELQDKEMMEETLQLEALGVAEAAEVKEPVQVAVTGAAVVVACGRSSGCGLPPNARGAGAE